MRSEFCSEGAPRPRGSTGIATVASVAKARSLRIPVDYGDAPKEGGPLDHRRWAKKPIYLPYVIPPPPEASYFLPPGR
jgi:hypothetical protein